MTSDETNQKVCRRAAFYRGLPCCACETLYPDSTAFYTTVYTLLSTALYSVECRDFTPQGWLGGEATRYAKKHSGTMALSLLWALTVWHALS